MPATFLETLVLDAPAKINLFLHVNGRRDDGYHYLQTAYQFLDFKDTIKFSLTNSKQIIRIDNHSYDLPKNDLVVQAANLLRRHHPTQSARGVCITLTKHIPTGAGMGGGSSNAASTLLAMNRLWGLNLSKGDLLDYAIQLGADVPIFIRGTACFASGIGEIFQPLSLVEHWYCFCIPAITVSTADVFSHLDLKRDHIEITPDVYHSATTENALESITRILYPEIDHAISILNKFGKARMNGSGSSAFIRCKSRDHAKHICAQLPKSINPFVTRSLNSTY